MKRFIYLFTTLLLFFFSSCNSPMSDIDEKNKDVDQVSDHLSADIPSGISQARADSIRKNGWQYFREQHGPEWKVNWDKKTGIPTSMFLGTTKPIAGKPEQAARTFLKQHRILFGMKENLADLKLLEVDISSRGMHHVRLQQTYKGIPVHKGIYQVHIRPDKRIDMINGKYYPNINVSTTSSVNAASAQRTALSDLGSTVDLKNDIESKRMIYHNPTEETFSLAWKILITAGDPSPGEWQYFIDATNGQILDKLNLVTSITGDGDIIENHPGITPSPVNENLYRLNGSGYLQGQFANVHNDINNRAYSANNNFQYSTSSTHFDEVNVYYHLDTFRAGYLSNLGFNSKIGSDYDIEAWVHDITKDPNNAGYYPGAEELRFGYNYDFAKEDKVIYHEFIHAVADVKNGSHLLDPNPTEEGAIGEGLADYFSGSYTGRAQTGNWVLSDPRDMEEPDYSDYSQIPKDSNTGNIAIGPHTGGEFFSSILWDLRNSGKISPHDVDILAFEAIGRLSGGPNFIGFRNAMMAEDDFINSGSNNNAIQDAFAAKGIGNFSPLGVSISGPDMLDSGESGTWTATISNADSPYDYSWWRKTSSSNWNLVSSNSSYTGSGNSDFQIKLDVTDSNSKTGSTFRTIAVDGIDPPETCLPCVRCPCDINY